MSAYTPTDLSNYYTKAETDARDLWKSGTGANSVAQKGSLCEASGAYSVAEGEGTTATSSSSHAEGFRTRASGGYSHAEGYTTVASGNFTHVEGKSTSATTSFAHAEGENTWARGPHSHAEGYNVECQGDAAHAEGTGTITANQSEHASGQYNVTHLTDEIGFGSSGKTLFSVGNGTSGGARHNALEIMQNGDIYIKIGNADKNLQNYLLALVTRIDEIERIVSAAINDLNGRVTNLEQ